MKKISILVIVLLIGLSFTHNIYADSLTSNQVKAVLNMLRLFEMDDSSVKKIEETLNQSVLSGKSDIKEELEINKNDTEEKEIKILPEVKKPFIESVSHKEAKAGDMVVLKGSNLYSKEAPTLVRFFVNSKLIWSINSLFVNTSIDGSGITLSVDPDIIKINGTGSYEVKTFNSLIGESNGVELKLFTENVSNSARVLVCGQRGDVDGDGDIDIADANLVRSGVRGGLDLSENEMISADVNRDEETDTLDVALMDRYISGEIEGFGDCVLDFKNTPYTCDERGDLNGDSFVTNEDLSMLRDHVSGVNQLSTANKRFKANLDHNGDITSDDLRLLRSYLVGTIETFPVCTPPVIESSKNETASILNAFNSVRDTFAGFGKWIIDLL